MIREASPKALVFESAKQCSEQPVLDTILQLVDKLDSRQLNELGTHLENKRRHRFTPAPAAVEQLTVREKEVLVLVASGYNRKEIGRTLGISACTAAKHIANIYRKLGVSTIAEATRMALVEISD